MGEGGTGLGERDETKRVYMYISLRSHKSNIPSRVPPRPACTRLRCVSYGIWRIMI